MPKITIRNFSCIKSADIDLRRLNVLIGPQGSGKSVTTKLIYFFADLPQEALSQAEDGLNLPTFKKRIEKLFSAWFPPSAWGLDKFNINYIDETFTVRVMRRMSKGRPTDEVAVSFCQAFDDGYNRSLEYFLASKDPGFWKTENSEAQGNILRDTIESSWRVRDEARKILRGSLGLGTVSSQTFIPAGRAFFTSIGRLVAGIENSSSLDPATLKFAKMFAGWRDRIDGFRPSFSKSQAYEELRTRIMFELFSGKVQSKRDLEFIEMQDGRRVPFSSLSSGQQELLPIWYFIDNLMLFDWLQSDKSTQIRRVRSPQIIYIEEPEAHLFPSSQSILIDTLVEVIVNASKSRLLVVTTHSPYIMARLNVLIKAGQMSKRRKKNTELNEIVDRAKWLQASDVLAMSIEGGSIKEIMDDDLGIIDAAFLDSISDSLSSDFSKLLDLEELF